MARKELLEAVLTKFAKFVIQQADDFKITFESDFKKTGIAERIGLMDNTLKHYVEYELPKTGSLEKWLFNVFLKTYLKDSNAVVITVPDYDEFVENPSQVTTLDWSNLTRCLPRTSCAGLPRRGDLYSPVGQGGRQGSVQGRRDGWRNRCRRRHQEDVRLGQ